MLHFKVKYYNEWSIWYSLILNIIMYYFQILVFGFKIYILGLGYSD